MSKVLELSKGYSTLLDDEDYETYSNKKWFASVDRKGRVHAQRSERKNKKSKTIILHRLIMNAKPGESVDHINGDTLDNRKSNLRICTVTENNRNTKGAVKLRKYSNYKGVTQRKDRRGWLSIIWPNGKCVWLGTFETELEAAKAYDEAAKKYYGAFAKPNFKENE